jgi:hypothetical protein
VKGCIDVTYIPAGFRKICIAVALFRGGALTLVIDMYDGSSKQVVWRGMASDTLSSKPEKKYPEARQGDRQAVREIPSQGRPVA